MKAILALEDGSMFTGRAFGAEGETSGEVVFNTSMTGYQEIITDPSYTGQIVVMTYPHIGNYGVNDEDEEASRPYAEGFVAREFSECASNWRSQGTFEDYLKRRGIVSISEVDTRALVRHIRSRGAMRGIISTVETDPAKLTAAAKAIPTMAGSDLASLVSCREPYARTGAGTGANNENTADGVSRFRVVAWDYGIKRSILDNLVRVGCDVTVVPAATSAADILAMKPDGVFLSNGPGDPEPLEYAVKNIRTLLGKVPVFGICLGHQLMGLAFGGKTYKLKFGHRGANHPVKNLLTSKIEITSQNHGFAVDPDSLDATAVELTHLNLNDHTLEGLRHRSLPAFSVQYHPEASPGPHDSHYLFDEFKQLMLESR
ncbi:MAG: glutamine-hydrolyzing carbamoyl-phosphate synthase small subunit [Acidobacteriota bacterium]|jgi:carbamoyl-phosphate synthase small subunit|nr:glutamine-hydrolyzing carbamoyl-phosphate synthase small subunit [Acidobacteriota bacterium]